MGALLLSVVAIAWQQAPTASSQAPPPGTTPFFDLDVLATAGGTIAGFGPGPSMDDSGRAAFVGKVGASEGLFTADGSGAPFNFNPASTGLSGRFYGDAVQINNARQVVAREQLAGSPPTTRIRRWDAATTNSSEIVAVGGSSGAFTSVLGFDTINSSGSIVFPAQSGSSVVLVGDDGFQSSSVGTAVRPLMADDGRVVVRARNSSGGDASIRLYGASFFGSQTVACTTAVSGCSHTGFTYVGQSPGISDDGLVVAFYGEHPTLGTGVFASIDNGGGVRSLVRVAGPGKEGPPVIERDQRVGVNGDASVQRAVTIGFVAYDGLLPGGQKGLWAARLNFFGTGASAFDPAAITNRYTVIPPALAFQAGQAIAGVAGTVADVGIYDPVNRRDRGDLVAWVRTSATEAIVRARPNHVVYLDFDPKNTFVPGPDATSLLVTGMGMPATWAGSAAEALARLAPARADLRGAAMDAIQTGVVDRVQAAFDQINTAPGVSVNVRVLGRPGEALPTHGPFTRVYIGDGWNDAANPSGVGGVAHLDIFNQRSLYSSGPPAGFSYVQTTPLIFVDNIFRTSPDPATCALARTPANKKQPCAFTDEDPNPALAIPISLADTGTPFEITPTQVEIAIADVTAHEVGHSMGLSHIDNDLNSRLMNANTTSPLTEPRPGAVDELRREQHFGTLPSQLDTGAGYNPGENESGGRRLAFAAGSDIDAGVVPREAPSAPVIAKDVREAYKAPFAVSEPVSVTRAVLGIVARGEEHSAPEFVDLGAGDLATLLDREIEIAPRDRVFLVASTTGDGIDVFSTDAAMPVDPATVDLSQYLLLLTEERIRARVTDDDGNPAGLGVNLWQVPAGGGMPERIGSFGGPGSEPGEPAVTLDPGSLDFGAQRTGTTSAQRRVTLRNSGSAPLAIASIALAGPDAGDFARATSCPASLAVDAECSIDVTLTPSATGPRAAELRVVSDAAGSPHGVALAGTGVAPAARLTPSAVDFGPQRRGTASLPRSLTLANTGTDALAIGSVALAGAHAGDYALDSRCGPTLAPGASCEIRATFRPTASGIREAVVRVSSDASGSPRSATLTGRGCGILLLGLCLL